MQLDGGAQVGAAVRHQHHRVVQEMQRDGAQHRLGRPRLQAGLSSAVGLRCVCVCVFKKDGKGMRRSLGSLELMLLYECVAQSIER